MQSLSLLLCCEGPTVKSNILKKKNKMRKEWFWSFTFYFLGKHVCNCEKVEV